MCMQTHLKTWTHCVRPHITQTHTYTHLLTHSAALTQLALMLWILALWRTWSPVGRDLAVIQLLTGPSCSVSAVSTLTQVENVTPSWVNHSEALLLFLRCCLGIHTFPFPPFSASCSKIELPFVRFDFFSSTALFCLCIVIALLLYEANTIAFENIKACEQWWKV